MKRVSGRVGAPMRGWSGKGPIRRGGTRIGIGSLEIAIVIATLFASAPMAGAAIPRLPAPTVISTVLPPATQGDGYLVDLAASGGTAPYTWSLLTGPVPLGLVLSSWGTISGVPGTAGSATIMLRVTDASGSSSTAAVELTIQSAPPPPQQVVTLTSDGIAMIMGTAYANPNVDPVSARSFVGVTSSPNGDGAWGVTSSGRVVAVGGVPIYGEVPVRRARNGVIGIASNATGTGYWIVTRFGRVYGFGAARAKGSLTGITRHDEVVGIARAAGGSGYYLVQSTGRVTAFGSAQAHGSLRARHLHMHIAGITSMVTGSGYWIAATDGRIFAFGDARGHNLAGPVVTGRVTGIAAATTGVGVYLLEASGAVLSFGSALALAPTSTPSAGRVVAISASV